ncbi:TetR/AcrR family transcriptional regulator [Rhodopila sp.]|uniref:TetR/AcrR family transcriptional regulator n=1 Tax=Rhodopila sp. TaxID=2480087 RepID=UPI002D7FF15E|nr:TetR/AcrR family transcriptional regulator [Rhodopila sp.]
MIAERPGTAEAESPKRKAILEAASRLFMAEGYGAVSMDAIARAASVSKATLYAHFGAKDRLFAAIITGACERMEREHCGALESAGLTIRETVRLVGRHWLEFMLSEPAVAVRRMVVAEGPKFPELAHAFYENGPRVSRAWLADWIAAETARGRLTCKDPECAAEQFVALFTGDLILRATLGLEPRPDPLAVDRQIDAATDTFCRAFAVGMPGLVENTAGR